MQFGRFESSFGLAPLAAQQYVNPIVLIWISTLLACAAITTLAMWLGPAWDAFARFSIKDLTPRMQALGLDGRHIDQWMRWWGLAIVITLVVVGALLRMSTVAVGMAILIYIAPRFLLDWMLSHRQIKLRDQLVRASMGIASSCRAGMALAQSIDKVSGETPWPLRDELQRIARYYKGGGRIQDALREADRRLAIEAFTVFASASIVSLERGGNITAALEKISEGLQEMQRLDRKLEADSASGKRLALVLGCFPAAFLLLFSLLDPVSTGLLYTTLLGNLVLCLVGAIVAVAVKWCTYILDMDF